MSVQRQSVDSGPYCCCPPPPPPPSPLSALRRSRLRRLSQARPLNFRVYYSDAAQQTDLELSFLCRKPRHAQHWAKALGLLHRINITAWGIAESELKRHKAVDAESYRTPAPLQPAREWMRPQAEPRCSHDLGAALARSSACSSPLHHPLASLRHAAGSRQPSAPCREGGRSCRSSSSSSSSAASTSTSARTSCAASTSSAARPAGRPPSPRQRRLFTAAAVRRSASRVVVPRRPCHRPRLLLQHDHRPAAVGAAAGGLLRRLGAALRPAREGQAPHRAPPLRPHRRSQLGRDASLAAAAQLWGGASSHLPPVNRRADPPARASDRAARAAACDPPAARRLAAWRARRGCQWSGGRCGG